MADKQTTGGTLEDPTATALKAMTDLQKAGLGPMTWMGTTMLENMSAMGSEVTQFIADRIKEDVKAQHQIIHCKDAGELRKIQSDFVQNAIEQYTTETGKLVEMSNKFMTSALKGNAN